MFLWSKLKDSLKEVKNRWSGGLGFLFFGSPINGEFLGSPEENFLFCDGGIFPVSFTHFPAHETGLDIVCRLFFLKKKKTRYYK